MIETNEKNRFPVGTKITSIDNKLIHKIAAKYSMFSEITHESQDWQHILDIASIIEIENLNGELQTFKLKDYELISTNLKPSFFNVNRNLEYIEDEN